MHISSNEPILVTGSTGFIGSSVASRLARAGRQVILLVRSGATFRYRKSELESCTIIEYDKLTSIHHVLSDFKPIAIMHLAASIVEETNAESVADLIEGNFALGVHLLHEATSRGCRCFIFAGSFWQFGDKYHPGPNTLYADLKQSFCTLLNTYGKRNSISTASLILHDVFGEGDKRGKIIDILLSVARGAPSPRLTPGMQILDLTHVDDVAAAFEDSMNHLLNNRQILNEQWWVSGRRIILKDLAAIIEKIKGCTLGYRWAEKPYSKNVIMEPMLNSVVPGWKPNIDLEKWLAQEIKRC